MYLFVQRDHRPSRRYCVSFIQYTCLQKSKEVSHAQQSAHAKFPVSEITRSPLISTPWRELHSTSGYSLTRPPLTLPSFHAKYTWTKRTLHCIRIYSENIKHLIKNWGTKNINLQWVWRGSWINARLSVVQISPFDLRTGWNLASGSGTKYLAQSCCS